LARRTRRQLARLAVVEGDRGGLPLAAFRRLPVADQRRLLQALYRRLSGRDLPFEAVERLRALAAAAAPAGASPGDLASSEEHGGAGEVGAARVGAGMAAALDLPGGWRVRREGDHLWVEPGLGGARPGGVTPGGPQGAPAGEAGYRYELPVPG